MFDWLRRLFRKKPKEENMIEIKQETPEQSYREPETVQEPHGERLAPHSSHEPDRPEKMCAKCGSPNDKFVHVCWMCKAEI